jgi:CRISPR system Cascade subunit CasE
MQPDGKRKNGKRVPLVNLEELHSWIIRKSITGGFRVVEDKPLEISPMMESHFRKKDRKSGKDQSAYHGGVLFRGTLEVIDPEKFVETYQSGIGSAKGFGFGLLLLAPLNL